MTKDKLIPSLLFVPLIGLLTVPVTLRAGPNPATGIGSNTAPGLDVAPDAGPLSYSQADDSTSGPDSDVTVYLVMPCPMAHIVCKAAETTAIQLFGRIGVHLRFTNTRPEQPDSGAINLLVLNRAPKSGKREVLGVTTTDQEFGPVVYVFYDHVVEFSEPTYAQDAGVVLGYVIAHELGHALRGEPGHSLDGVMKAHWTPQDRAAMIRHAVAFSRADSERIRHVLAERKLVKTASIPGN